LVRANGISVTRWEVAPAFAGALGARLGELVLDMGGFDRILDLDETTWSVAASQV